MEDGDEHSTSRGEGLEPARSVIAKCGGLAAVVEMTGRHPTRCRRWMYPKERGGTGGLIPIEVAIRLLDEADRRGIALKADDFLPHASERGGTM